MDIGEVYKRFAKIVSLIPLAAEVDSRITNFRADLDLQGEIAGCNSPELNRDLIREACKNYLTESTKNTVEELTEFLKWLKDNSDLKVKSEKPTRFRADVIDDIFFDIRLIFSITGLDQIEQSYRRTAKISGGYQKWLIDLVTELEEDFSPIRRSTFQIQAAMVEAEEEIPSVPYVFFNGDGTFSKSDNVVVINMDTFAPRDGTKFPQTNVKSRNEEQLTLSEFASLLGLSEKTLQNQNSTNPLPKPARRGRGRNKSLYEFAELREWALKVYPEECLRLPNEYSKAAGRLGESKVSISGK